MPTRTVLAAICLALLGAVTAQADTPVASSPAPAPPSFCQTQDTQTCQTAVSPQQVLEHLKQGNERFVAGVATQRNFTQQVKATAKGQYPLASIVSCIDSRVPAEIVFDSGIGDLFNARIAGNVANDDILGSLEFASKVAGSKLVVVLGHTSCGAVKGACDNVQLGNLTGLLAKIQPAVAAVPVRTGVDRSSKNAEFVEMVAAINVQQNVQRIRDRSPILKEMEDKGEIKIVGAMYDVATGTVTWLD
jgi:carbonic anhydrase